MNLKNVCARDQLKSTFENPEAQLNIDLDLNILECYHRELSKLEWHMEQQAKHHNPVCFTLLRSIPGVGRILALTILYEIGDIQRFESVQNVASYSRLVKWDEVKGQGSGLAFCSVINSRVKGQVLHFAALLIDRLTVE